MKMKMLLIFALAICAVRGFAADTKASAEYWYGEGYKTYNELARIAVIDAEGIVDAEEVPVIRYSDSSINWDNTSRSASTAYALALKAAQTALDAKAATKNLADKLAAEFAVDTEEVETKKPNDNGSTTDTIDTYTTTKSGTTFVLTPKGDVIKALNVDGKSVGVIDDTYQVKGYGSADCNTIPTKDTDGIKWVNVGNWADGVTIEKNVGTAGALVNTIKLKDWGDATSEGSNCNEDLATQLQRETEAETHYVLTKKIDGTGAGCLHYTKVGRMSGGGAAADEQTITTNGVTRGKLQIKSGTTGQYLASGANASAQPTWNTPSEVTVVTGLSIAVDASDDSPKLTITMTRQKLKVFGAESANTLPAELALSKAAVVTSTEYDTTYHMFYDRVRTAVFLAAPTEETRRSTHTFEATEVE